MRDMDVGATAQTPYRVGVLPIPGFALMSYACTVEPLRAANLLAGAPLFEVVHFCEAARTPSSGAAQVERTCAVGADVPLDMLLVVAGGDPFAFRDRGTFRWLARMARKGVTLGGVSGGAVILTAAGLMEGRRMTVHWEHAALLAERHPEAIIERRLFVMDRDRVTCGGGTAPMDLMHSLIATRHGPAFAGLVSDWFLHTNIRAAAAPQRGGVAERLGAFSPHVGDAVQAMENHIGDPLSLSQLSDIVGVTPRHLGRLFMAAFGASAMAYYRELRLEAARRLVRSTGLRIGDIADATGFSNAGHLSNAYKAQFGLPPTEDRGGRNQPVA